MKYNFKEYAKVFKALSDETRLKIIKMLSETEELCACKILESFNITQPTLSYHMKILVDSGLVLSNKVGFWMHYKVNLEKLNEITEFLENKLEEEGFMQGEKIDLYVLTGFLGSGKTTILLKLLDLLKDERIGVIQNEFGKLSIDGMILKKDNLEMTEINRGSIFCSCLKLSFVQALVEMSNQNLKYLFVESSGLADPSNVEEILEGVKSLCGDKYNFKGAICLIDAVNFLDQLEDLETVNRQLKHCHMAIINKVDLVSQSELEKVIEELRKINPVCDIVTGAFGNFEMDFLNKNLLENHWVEGEETTNSADTKPKTLTMNFNGTVKKEKMEEFLNTVKDKSYRIKGFFKLEDGWNQIDVVGKRIDYKSCDEKEASQMVFISKIGPAIIRPIINNWNEIIGEEMELKN